MTTGTQAIQTEFLKCRMRMELLFGYRAFLVLAPSISQSQHSWSWPNCTHPSKHRVKFNEHLCFNPRLLIQECSCQNQCQCVQMSVLIRDCMFQFSPHDKHHNFSLFLTEGKSLRDEESLQLLPVGTTATFYFKDLGPQIGWTMVSIIGWDI